MSDCLVPSRWTKSSQYFSEVLLRRNVVFSKFSFYSLAEILKNKGQLRWNPETYKRVLFFEKSDFDEMAKLTEPDVQVSKNSFLKMLLYSIIKTSVLLDPTMEKSDVFPAMD
jgi:hypothetical protein